MKALDIVVTPKGGIAVVKETYAEGKRVSIDYINNCNKHHERNAWWNAEDLQIIDSIPRLLANAMYHPFGRGKEDVEKFFNPNPNS